MSASATGLRLVTTTCRPPGPDDCRACIARRRSPPRVRSGTEPTNRTHGLRDEGPGSHPATGVPPSGPHWSTYPRSPWYRGRGTPHSPAHPRGHKAPRPCQAQVPRECAWSASYRSALRGIPIQTLARAMPQGKTGSEWARPCPRAQRSGIGYGLPGAPSRLDVSVVRNTTWRRSGDGSRPCFRVKIRLLRQIIFALFL